MKSWPGMKNQATIEFMLIFTVLLLGIAVAAAVSFQKIKEVNSQQTAVEAEDVLRDLASSLDKAFIEGDGFITTAYLPDMISGRQYNITLYPNQLVLEVGGKYFTRYTIVQNFSGSIKKGANTLKNSGGIIEIS
jgi:uncharacterized protein (UPF0333 family)